MPTVYGVPNCVGWYVANQGVYADTLGDFALNQVQVAQWNDASGAGNHLTQPTAANRPVFNNYASGQTASGPATLAPYGSPIEVDQPSYAKSVLFDGSASYLNLPATLGLTAAGCTVVMCSRGASAAAVSFGTDGMHGLAYGGFGTAPLRVGVYTPSAGAVPFPAATHLPNLQPTVHGFRCDGSAGLTTLFVGTNQQSTLPTNYCNGPLSGGAVGRVMSGSAGMLGFAGEVFELLIYAGPLTDAQVAAVLADVQAANRLRADANGSQVVFVGDSLTAGGPGIQPVSHCYPWHLCRHYGGAVKPLVTATPGQTVAQQRAVVNQQVLPLDRTPFAASVAVVVIGSNDLWLGGAAADTAAAVADLCGAVRSAGFKVIVGTITPRAAGSAAQQVTLSSAVSATNATIRGNYAAYADALLDWAADPRLADYTDAIYFADGCHTTDAGDGVKAQLVKAVLDPLLTPPASSNPVGTAPMAALTFGAFYTAGRTFTGQFGRFPRA